MNPKKASKQREVKQMLLSINEACRAMSIGRTTLYGLIQAGTISVVKIGRRGIRVPASELERFAEEGGIDAA